ncbi:Nitrate reductase [NADH] 2 [Sesamum alatum]|uniref:Nitrate reductase [NADH] 2 n=1 Tax=Sesamum alatum TaxID=300844 RepID=A0AAE1YVL6_9LAMI|nr:Nitrate reductase [NADH] 2 [Sesamum alatum]
MEVAATVPITVLPCHDLHHTIKEVLPTTKSVALVPREKIPCKLVAKTSLSHDVRLFRFASSIEEQVLGLPIEKHIFRYATIDDKLYMRTYTPSSTVRYIELVVNVYLKWVHPNFPNGGQISQHLDSLELGSSLDMKGSSGHTSTIEKGTSPCTANKSLPRNTSTFVTILFWDYPIEKHIFLYSTIDDKLYMRAYTPSSTVRYIELVGNVYVKWVHSKLPQWCANVAASRLPGIGFFSAHERVFGPHAYFTVHSKQKFSKKLTMIAGGTGSR